MCAALAAAGAACSSSPPQPTLTKEELMDPASCNACHPTHVQDWAGSMHAYASDDPVFVAMNARAQRESNVGDFCVKCHAPMAVLTGATTDGTNLASVDPSLKGVTCYFCHSAAAVNGTHDNPITLASDGVLRAAIDDPTPNTAHQAGYGALQDRTQSSSATLCGSCHDVVNLHGAHIERTFAEWQGTLFSHGELELTCGECHMDGSQGLAAQYPGVGLRRVHSHQFPGVDQALTMPFPEVTEQQLAVQGALDTTLQAALCVKGVPGQATVQVVLDNVGTGHAWPSGATQDRRAWVEVIAYDANSKVLYQSGVVGDGQSVVALTDPDLWLIRDCLFDAQGKGVSMMWQASSYESNQLPGPVTANQTDPRYYLTHLMRDYPQLTSTPPFLATMPDHVTMRVRLIPVGIDVLDDLVQSGDLDPSVKSMMPTYALAGTTLEWTAAAATIKYLDQGLPVLCVSSGLSAGTTGANPAPGHMSCKP
jgi:hypothetical protein